MRRSYLRITLQIRFTIHKLVVNILAALRHFTRATHLLSGSDQKWVGDASDDRGTDDELAQHSLYHLNIALQIRTAGGRRIAFGEQQPGEQRMSVAMVARRLEFVNPRSGPAPAIRLTTKCGRGCHRRRNESNPQRSLDRGAAVASAGQAAAGWSRKTLLPFCGEKRQLRIRSSWKKINGMILRSPTAAASQRRKFVA